jgi:hypothetical protein
MVSFDLDEIDPEQELESMLDLDKEVPFRTQLVQMLTDVSCLLGCR